MIIKNNNTIHLQGKNISYIMFIGKHGDLLHYYFGKKLKDREYEAYNVEYEDYYYCAGLDRMLQEYPSYGHRGFKNPSYSILNENGNAISQLEYKNVRIENEAAYVKGMPHIMKKTSSAQTAYITLADKNIGLEVELAYTVFDEYDIIARSAKIINKSNSEIKLQNAASMCLELESKERNAVYFCGSWGRERELQRVSIMPGMKLEVSNAHGASGHEMNPFVMICDEAADENNGEVYSMSLIYSGNHSTVIESDVNNRQRIIQGINPMGFEEKLMSGEEFYTPQSIICYSAKGFGGISRELSDVIKNNICRSKFTNEDRPILINNWEGTYFDFTEEKLLNIAKKAKEAGVELFVLDDGWFGIRNDDKSGLGDWFVNKDKLPSGIDGLAKKVNDIGLKFGLWFEPEMVNPDSQLFRAHPDWAVRVPEREPSLGRNQLILDLAKPEVCDYVVNAVCDILGSADISYVKWDMNRSMSDMPYMGYNHKFILGLYNIMERITGAFPDILFEGCAGGGGRFDLGILYYMPQIWTSDNSDAIARLKIQYSTSMGYPASAISAHVTASPNHQNGRVTPLKTRADAAYMGVFGYELDITKMAQDEFEEVKAQIEFVKSIRTLQRTGDFYRLQNPYEENICSWEIAAKDQSEAFFMGCKILAQANCEIPYVCLKGLDSDAEYIDVLSGKQYYGDELMYKGVRAEYGSEYGSDFTTFIMHLKKKEL